MEYEGLDLSIVSEPKHVYYFTGYMTPRLFLPSYLFAFRGEEPVLLTGQTDLSVAENTFGGEVATFVNYDLNQRMVAYPGFVASEAKRLLAQRKRSLRRVGIESWSIPEVILRAATDHMPQNGLFDLSPEVMKMRSVKDSDEIAHIRRSCELNDFAYSVAKSVAAPGRSEVEVYGLVHHELAKKVGTFQFFGGDFVSGERTLEIGGPPTTRVLRQGDLLILDLWVTTKGYWSDTCRTFVVGAQPNDEQKRALNLLRQAMAAGEEKLRPGAKGRDVYEAVRDAISRGGHGQHFPHHAGHNIGLDGQEGPFFIPASEEELREGMVCTLEPGVYVPGLGGMRIEHNYLIRDRGVETLTKFPLDL